MRFEIQLQQMTLKACAGLSGAALILLGDEGFAPTDLILINYEDLAPSSSSSWAAYGSRASIKSLKALSGGKRK